MKRKGFRLSDDLEKQILKDQKEKRIESENQYIIDALKHFLSCKKLETTGAMKLIILKYPSHCLKCGNKINVGDYALWGRGIGAICMDCYVVRIGDKPLIVKFLKMRELKQLIKALNDEANRLGDKVEEGQLYEKMEQMFQDSSEIHKLVMSYLREGLGTEKEKKELEEIIRLREKEFQILRDIEDFLQRKMKLRKKKKKKIAGVV